MKRSFYLIPFFQLLFSTITFGQETTKTQVSKTSSETAISVTFHPLFLLNNAIKLDAELQTNKPLAFIIGAEIYGGDVSSLYKQRNDFGEAVEDKISGFAINLAVKYKIDQSKNVNSFYFSPGLTYRRLNLELSGPAYYSYVEDGIEYFSYGNTKQNQKVNPLLLYGNLGKYYEFGSIVADIYVGIGYKVLKQNQVLLDTRKYHEEIFGYNFKGAIFQLGVKLGWQITK